MAPIKRSSITSIALVVLASVSMCIITSVECQLQVGFYKRTCFLAENIVRDEVEKAFFRDRGVAAGLARMHFHDCFVRGCDGSVLIDSTSNNMAEKDSPANNPSLRGFEVIDRAKARLETVCQGVVSCADILAFAARDSIDLAGGLDYDVPSGRRDGRVSLASDIFANLPPPIFTLPLLTQLFAAKGFTQDEMVTLSGAHTIGRAHCNIFANDRLYNFNGTGGQDPSLDPVYAARLKQLCPQGSTDPNLVVPMDPRTPNELDVEYYKGILANRGLFISDQTLVSSPQSASQVTQNANNQLAWKIKFNNAMVKMGQLDVLTGTAGEIRANCRVIN